nr:gliding motility-associated C-terminal domain-containing protein [Pseudopedobacter sp.]
MKYLLIFVFLFGLLGFQTQAQICIGSLGDPTVTQSFGTGTGVGPSLTADNTGLNYSGSDCPNDGNYVIVNKTSNCFGGSWHTVNEDHTPGDTNGYMMLVNAKNTPDIFYTFSVNNLCPNTTYELSSYIMNVRKASSPCSGNSTVSYPDITFVVETENGQVIGSSNTGLIYETNTPEWKKYGFFFKSPPNVSKVVLKLINNTLGGGCGNDLALDDITFRPCGPTILANENSTISSSLTLCEGATQAYTFKADVSSGYLKPAFLWQEDKHDGNDWVNIPNSSSSTYQALITNADKKGYSYRMAAAEEENIANSSCRVYSNVIEVKVVPSLVIDAGKDVYVLENSATKILATAPPNLVYEWSPATYLSDPHVLQPIVKPTETTIYTLTVTDLNSGCEAMAEVTVHVDQDIKIPDTFSPNGDGVNDLWQIQGLLGNSDVDITIFNRNGQKVYAAKGYPKAWDGKLKNNNLPQGMYYYIIDTHSPIRPLYRGSVLIIY